MTNINLSDIAKEYHRTVKNKAEKLIGDWLDELKDDLIAKASLGENRRVIKPYDKIWPDNQTFEAMVKYHKMACEISKNKYNAQIAFGSNNEIILHW